MAAPTDASSVPRIPTGSASVCGATARTISPSGPWYTASSGGVGQSAAIGSAGVPAAAAMIAASASGSAIGSPRRSGVPLHARSKRDLMPPSVSGSAKRGASTLSTPA